MKTKIAINLGHKFVAIPAETVTILGIPLAIHKTPGKSGWSVTDPRSGFALNSKQPSQDTARHDALIKISATGREKVLALIAAQPAAPPVETLEDYVPRAKKSPADVDGVVNAIASIVELNEVEKAAVKLALNSRTGQLKAKSPSAFGSQDERLACAAWQAIQPNGYKVSLGAVLFLKGEARDLYEKLSKHIWPVALDKDLSALRALGVA